MIITFRLYRGVALDQCIPLVSFFLLFKMRYNLYRVKCTDLKDIIWVWQMLIKIQNTSNTPKSSAVPLPSQPQLYGALPPHTETTVLISITNNDFSYSWLSWKWNHTVYILFCVSLMLMTFIRIAADISSSWYVIT